MNTGVEPPLIGRRWWYLAFGAVLVFASLIGLAFRSDLYEWYVRVYVEPQLENSLGFRLGEVQVLGPHGPNPINAVVAVTPGGVFDRAGVRAGDIPLGYDDIRSELFAQLHRSPGTDVRISFANQRDAARGIWQSREIIIKVPRRRAG